MIDHIGVYVKNYKKSKEFYEKVLKPLGYKLGMEFGEAAGFMTGKRGDFWVMKKAHKDKTHIAFSAKSKQAVQAFYKAAIEAGGKDNGKPGIRKDYDPKYYAAFVRDPDGHNIEAVTFK